MTVSKEMVDGFVNDWRNAFDPFLFKDNGKHSESGVNWLHGQLNKTFSEDEEVAEWFEKYGKHLIDRGDNKPPTVLSFLRFVGNNKLDDSGDRGCREEGRETTSLAQLPPEKIAENRERIARMKKKLKGVGNMRTKEASAYRGGKSREDIESGVKGAIQAFGSKHSE